MTISLPVFLDANVLIYALDNTSEPNAETVVLMQQLLQGGTALCTSHHVIEEVLHVARKIQREVSPAHVVEEIGQISDLVLIEPAADLDFARRYAALSMQLKLGINDALILQLMLDAGISKLFSYDKKLLDAAGKLGIEKVV